MNWGTAAHARAIRTTTLCVWAVVLLTTPYWRYSIFESDLLEGFGIGRVILGTKITRQLLTDVLVLALLQGVGLAGCIISLVLGSRAWAPVLVAFVAIVLLDAVAKSAGGFANHAQSLPLMLLGLVAWYSRSAQSSTSAFSSDPESRSGGTAWDCVLVASVLVVLPYTYIGLQRLVTGGFGMFTGDVLLRYFAAATGSFEHWPVGVNPPALTPLLNAGFAVVTLFEAGTVAVLLSSRFRLAWLVVMSGFHVSTLIAMNVFFWENLALISAVFWWGWARGTRAS